MTEHQTKHKAHKDRIKPIIIHIGLHGTDLQRIAADAWLDAYWGNWPKQNAEQYMNRIERALLNNLGEIK